jgi:AcrR family transcriptional regulator
MGGDHRKQPSRRGEALNAAIFQATLDELAEVGYAKLTMERVAERARTGKASLYRRWPSRMELAMDAVYHALPDPASPPDTGSLRGDLLALLRRNAELLAGPAGEALRGLLGDVLRDPTRTAELRQHSQGAGRKAMQEIARRAAERGEIDSSAVTPRRLEVGQAMLRQHFLFNGVPIPDSVIVEIVDEVIVPLLTC